jgi:hypothetical protein
MLAVVGFRWWTTSQWSYFQDDWVLMTAAGRDSLGHFMVTTQNGHLIPGGAFFLWVFTSVDPLNYTWFAVMTCGLTVLMLLGWGLALREMFGERLHLLGVLVLIGFSPPTSTVALWWSGNVFFFPLEAATGFAVWFLARYLLRGARRRDQVGVLLSVAVGLFFWNKSVLMTIPLGVLPLMVAPGTFGQRIRIGIRALWPTAVLVAAYLVVFVAVPRPAVTTFALEFPRGRTPGEIGDFLFTGLSKIAVPVMFGGPFGEISSPYGRYQYAAMGVRVICLVLAGTALVAALFYRRRAGWALLMAGAYLCASWGLVLFSSRFDVTGAESVFEGRYVCDMVPVFLLAAMFAVTRLRETTHEPLRRRVSEGHQGALRTLRLSYVVIAASLAVGFSVRDWEATEPNSPAPWVTSLVGDAKDLREGNLYDSVTPEYTLNPIFYLGRANLSDILSPLDADLRFNQPTENGYLIAGEDGHLSEGEVSAPATTTVTPGPDDSCGYSLEPGRTESLPLTGAIYEFEWIVQIDYFTSQDAPVTVRTDSKSVDLTLAATQPGAVSRTQYVVVDSVGTLEMTVAENADPVCVTVVKVGALAPTDRRPGSLTPLD